MAPSAEGNEPGPLDGAALPFDAVANMKLLGEVQRRGLEAANQVIARLTDRTRGIDDLGGTQNQMTAMADAMTEVMAGVVTAMSGASADADADGGEAGTRLRGVAEVLSGSGAPGAVAELELWLHNYTESDVEAVVHSTGLVHRSGEWIAPNAVGFDPPGPIHLPRRSTKAVVVSVDVPADAPSGHHRGVLCADDGADLWVVVDLDVEGSASDTTSP